MSIQNFVNGQSCDGQSCDIYVIWIRCESDEQALKIAAPDYGEILIHSVLSHEGNPDKLGELRFVVTFSDDPSVSTTRKYKEVTYVKLVRDYIHKHKDVLSVAAADLRKQDTAPPTRRVKRISSSLQGYEL